jgi:hypothetical protein
VQTVNLLGRGDAQLAIILVKRSRSFILAGVGRKPNRRALDIYLLIGLSFRLNSSMNFANVYIAVDKPVGNNLPIRRDVLTLALNNATPARVLLAPLSDRFKCVSAARILLRNGAWIRTMKVVGAVERSAMISCLAVSILALPYAILAFVVPARRWNYNSATAATR